MPLGVSRLLDSGIAIFTLSSKFAITGRLGSISLAVVAGSLAEHSSGLGTGPPPFFPLAANDRIYQQRISTYRMAARVQSRFRFQPGT